MSNTINILDLSKTFELNLTKVGVTVIPTLCAKLAVDRSGSMSGEFADGLVDRSIALFTAAAMKFDDDGALEMGFFNSSMTLTDDAKAADAGRYLQRVRVSAQGGTAYAPIIEAFESRLAVKDAAPAAPARGFLSRLFGSSTPVAAAPGFGDVREHRSYVGVITDGDAGDSRHFEAALAKTSGDTFYQFIAIGTGVTTSYLTEIASRYPHVSFFHLPDPKTTSDDEFFNLLCNTKLTAWIKAV